MLHSFLSVYCITPCFGSKLPLRPDYDTEKGKNAVVSCRIQPIFERQKALDITAVIYTNFTIKGALTMPETVEMKIIARIKSDFATKFGVPRQSGLVESLRAEIVFEPEYRVPEAVRGLDGYSHIWLIWQFSQAVRENWSPTVRPPRLGGNRRVGVFATRSPFRPNALGLSCVRLEGVELTPDRGPVLHVAGADLVDGTPIFDVKPYLPYADCRPDAAGGFTDGTPRRVLEVEISPELLERVPESKRDALLGVLSNDPRPSYQTNPERVYGLTFAGLEVKFRVDRETLYVLSVEPA